MSARHSCISPKVRLGELSACSIKACGCTPHHGRAAAPAPEQKGRQSSGWGAGGAIGICGPLKEGAGGKEEEEEFAMTSRHAWSWAAQCCVLGIIVVSDITRSCIIASGRAG